ncbi:hypothetical protein K227x_57720 [Rubripirellula lacrimiformis]|uniref:Uncharacterized protein n=1 Tax=Rubripirellula lacrimiformis TaxID=1930273 RepID=A0A517NJP1_9BACT|nr:hypothetical protein K227x_57720 [Rubripirellula lacrimiformis]
MANTDGTCGPHSLTIAAWESQGTQKPTGNICRGARGHRHVRTTIGSASLWDSQHPTTFWLARRWEVLENPTAAVRQRPIPCWPDPSFRRSDANHAMDADGTCDHIKLNGLVVKDLAVQREPHGR